MNNNHSSYTAMQSGVGRTPPVKSFHEVQESATATTLFVFAIITYIIGFFAGLVMITDNPMLTICFWFTSSATGTTMLGISKAIDLLCEVITKTAYTDRKVTQLLTENSDSENSKTFDSSNCETSSKLIVYGYTEKYIVSPPVDIFKNGIKIGEVNPKSMIEIPIYSDCTILFKCAFKTITIQAKAGKTQIVRLSFNRLTGKFSII